MLYANVGGEKMRATKGSKATCGECGGEMIAKCGDLVIWHWSHRSLEQCDPWAQGETQWHLEWKARFPQGQAEVVIRRTEAVDCVDALDADSDGRVVISHRADVLTPAGVIEFQHSPISVEEIRQREEFYERMYWVFDAREAYEQGRLILRLRRRDEENGERTMVRYWRWAHAKLSPLYVSTRQFWDIGNGLMFEPTLQFAREMEDGEILPARGIGNLRTRDEAVRIMQRWPGNRNVKPWMPLHLL